MIRILKCKQPPKNQRAVEDIIQKPVEWIKTPFSGIIYMDYFGITFVAIGPLSLVPVSKSTGCPSLRVLNPSI